MHTYIYIYTHKQKNKRTLPSLRHRQQFFPLLFKLQRRQTHAKLPRYTQTPLINTLPHHCDLNRIRLPLHRITKQRKKIKRIREFLHSSAPSHTIKLLVIIIVIHIRLIVVVVYVDIRAPCGSSL